MPLKKIVHAITVVSLFLLPIFPLIVADSYFFPFITGKAFFFRLMVEIAFAGWAILAFVDAKYRPKLTPLTIGVTVFAVVALIADLLGVNPLRSMWSNFERMEGWITIVHLWALYMVATNIFGAEDGGRRLWNRWLASNLGVATVVGFYGVVQLAGILSIHQGSTRIDASLGNSAYMAVYMLFNVGIAAYLFLSSSKKWTFKVDVKSLAPYWGFVILSLLSLLLIYNVSDVGSFFNTLGAFIGSHPWSFIIGLLVSVLVVAYPYYLLPVAFSVLVFETQTRGTIIGLIGGILLALLVYSIFAKNESKLSRRVSIGVFALIIIAGAIFWFNRNSPVIQNSEIFGRLANISWSEAQGQARNYIWPMAVKGTLERPVFGWGQENFNYIFNANYNPAMYAQEQWFDRAHSVFLDWLVASGFVGLFAYLALYVLFLVLIWKSSLTMAEKSVFTGLIAGYFIHNIFVFDNLASYVLFFIILAFADSQSGRKSRSIFGDGLISKDAIEYVVLPIVIVAFVLVAYFFQYRLMEANSRLITALRACSSSGQPDASLFEEAIGVGVYGANQEIREQLLSCTSQVIAAQQIAGPTKQAFFSAAMIEIQNQIAATPKDARVYTLAGSFLSGAGQFTDAISLLEKAHALSPNKQSISLELATDYMNAGEADKSIVLMKQTYEAYKDDAQAKLAYATALVVGGKESDAKSLFGNDQTVFNTAQMAQAYTITKQYSKAIDIYKSLIKSDPSDVNNQARLAQAQYSAGDISGAIATLRAVEKDHPDLKDQIEAAIKQVQK